MLLPLAAGQNAWQVMGFPQPVMPKQTVFRDADRSFPAITLVKLPILLQPMQPNAVVSGIKLNGIEPVGEPLIKMFTNDGYEMVLVHSE